MALREIRLVQTTRPFEYASPFPGQEHTLLVCVVDDSVTESERAGLSAEIVAAKCRYAVCWGYQCSFMEGAIGCAYIETDENFSPPDETFIMTTCHEDKSIEDAIDFWWMNTSFDYYVATRFAILIVGDNPELVEKIRSMTTELARHWNGQELTLKLG